MEELSLELSIHMSAAVKALLQTLLVYMFLPLVITGFITSLVFRGKDDLLSLVIKLSIIICTYFFITGGIQYMGELYAKKLSYVEETRGIALIDN